VFSLQESTSSKQSSKHLGNASKAMMIVKDIVKGIATDDEKDRLVQNPWGQSIFCGMSEKRYKLVKYAHLLEMKVIIFAIPDLISQITKLQVKFKSRSF